MSLLQKLLNKQAEVETSSSPAVDLSDKPAIHPKDPPSAGVMPAQQRPQPPVQRASASAASPPVSRQPSPAMARPEPKVPWGNGTAKLALFKVAAGENPGTPVPPVATLAVPRAA